jgi:dienelactone hydrolase
MRTLLCLLLLVSPLAAQAPAVDRRNAETPNTDTHFTMPHYATVAQWDARRVALRRQILAAAGLTPMPERTPLHPQVFGTISHEDYAVEKVLLETMPHYYLGANLYRPLKPGRYPAILIPHGHWEYGRLENQPLNSTPREGANLARQGYVALAIDMVGYNDTMQTPHEFGGSREQLWNFTALGLQLWNSTRALDYLLSREDVDTTRVGVTGASGGGTQTFLISAVDDRITASAPVNMVSAYMQGGAVCENAPGLRVGTSNLEFAAMMAPKPMLLVASTGDWTSKVPQEELPEIRQIYSLYGKAENLSGFYQDAPHNYNQKAREAVYQFFAKVLLHDPKWAEYKEQSVPVERLQDYLVLMGRPLPEGALDYASVFAAWRDLSLRQARAADVNALRENLRAAVGLEWPSHVEKALDGPQAILWRPEGQDRVPARILDAGKSALGQQSTPVAAAIVVVDPAGMGAAARELSGLPANHAAISIDAFQTGSAQAARDRSAIHFLGFNRSDDAARVQDILTALAFAKQEHPGVPLGVACVGQAALWCQVAAAAAPEPIKLYQTQPAGWTGTDDEMLKDLFLPGLNRAGGWETVQRLTK